MFTKSIDRILVIRFDRILFFVEVQQWGIFDQ